MSVEYVLPKRSFYYLCSFHVGSGCYDASAYATAVSAARSVFDLAVSEVALYIFVIDIFQSNILL